MYLAPVQFILILKDALPLAAVELIAENLSPRNPIQRECRYCPTHTHIHTYIQVIDKQTVA